MENPSFEMLAEFQYSSEAEIYKGRLEASGIEVFLRDQFTVDANPIWSNAVGGVKLYVRTEDAAQAQIILDEIAQFSIDDNGKEIQCPNCGASKAELVTTVKDRKSFGSFIVSVLLFGAMPLYVKYIYRCLECQSEFEIEDKN